MSSILPTSTNKKLFINNNPKAPIPANSFLIFNNGSHVGIAVRPPFTEQQLLPATTTSHSAKINKSDSKSNSQPIGTNTVEYISTLSDGDSLPCANRAVNGTATAAQNHFRRKTSSAFVEFPAPTTKTANVMDGSLNVQRVNTATVNQREQPHGLTGMQIQHY